MSQLLFAHGVRTPAQAAAEFAGSRGGAGRIARPDSGSDQEVLTLRASAMALWSANKEFIFKAVEEMYTDVAEQPGRVFHFPTGRLACLFVGYPAQQLDSIPAEAVESFAGVGYPFAANVIRRGDEVLDIGSGSGTDALIAAALTGPAGSVHALDMTSAMREKLARNVAAMGVEHVHVIAGNAEQIPLPSMSLDVVTTNGVLNLVPDKRAAFAEIARVLKPGGRVQIADIALRMKVSD